MSPKTFTSTFNEHCDGVATELDWLQDQLNNGGLNIDSSALLGLFSLDDPSLLPSFNNGNVVGNELVQFSQPNLETPNLNLDDLTDDSPQTPTTVVDSMLSNSKDQMSFINTDSDYYSPLNLNTSNSNTHSINSILSPNSQLATNK